jgi:hypothetical protein
LGTDELTDAPTSDTPRHKQAAADERRKAQDDRAAAKRDRQAADAELTA